jgi:hypothetical protein
MTHLVPKSNLVHDFLLEKGWILFDQTDKYYIFIPPSELRFKRPFWYQIPIYETASDYPRYIGYIVESIADIYELNLTELKKRLSKPQTIRKKSAGQRGLVRQPFLKEHTPQLR